jgi:glucosamine-6-phosphate deaminase
VDESQVKRLQFGTLKIEIHPSSKAAGLEAARAAGKAIAELAQTRETVGVIFATGASQLAILDALTSLPHIPWNRVCGFHMDEYVGISTDHRASFRRYLRDRLTAKVQMKEFFEIDGETADPEKTCREYAEKLNVADPKLCLLGVGENGHLAFNDPMVADFQDPADVKIVRLDEVCRSQQVNEGWFAGIEEVPECSCAASGSAVDCQRTGQAQGEDCPQHSRGPAVHGLSSHHPAHASQRNHVSGSRVRGRTG